MCQRLEVIDGKKRCFVCKAWKDTSLFYPDKRAFTKLRGRCKECDISRVNRDHTENLERAMKNLIIRHKANGRHGSKRRQRFTENTIVTLELLLEMWEFQDGKCAVTGVPLTHIQGKGFRVMSNVTLDRIDNDKGYVEGNIRLVCRAVNYMKACMSDSELIQWCTFILNGPVGQKYF